MEVSFRKCVGSLLAELLSSSVVNGCVTHGPQKILLDMRWRHDFKVSFRVTKRKDHFY